MYRSLPYALQAFDNLLPSKLPVEWPDKPPFRTNRCQEFLANVIRSAKSIFTSDLVEEESHHNSRRRFREWRARVIKSRRFVKARHSFNAHCRSWIFGFALGFLEAARPFFGPLDPAIRIFVLKNKAVCSVLRVDGCLNALQKAFQTGWAQGPTTRITRETAFAHAAVRVRCEMSGWRGDDERQTGGISGREGVRKDSSAPDRKRHLSAGKRASVVEAITATGGWRGLNNAYSPTTILANTVTLEWMMRKKIQSDGATVQVWGGGFRRTSWKQDSEPRGCSLPTARRLPLTGSLRTVAGSATLLVKLEQEGEKDSAVKRSEHARLKERKWPSSCHGIGSDIRRALLAKLLRLIQVTRPSPGVADRWRAEAHRTNAPHAKGEGESEE
ncbi:hypothetical protein DFJ73DRAFT_956458 [Zopfochytrium polystomum]|nr:hypothetical protein DFJ73DRAFT_956458 [Zopfochytrium polystomum]